jgi:hypothetical protein
VRPRFTDPDYVADLLAFYLEHCATNKDIKPLLKDELRLFKREIISEYQRNSE